MMPKFHIEFITRAEGFILDIHTSYMYRIYLHPIDSIIFNVIECRIEFGNIEMEL